MEVRFASMHSAQSMHRYSSASYAKKKREIFPPVVWYSILCKTNVVKSLFSRIIFWFSSHSYSLRKANHHITFRLHSDRSMKKQRILASFDIGIKLLKRDWFGILKAQVVKLKKKCGAIKTCIFAFLQSTASYKFHIERVHIERVHIERLQHRSDTAVDSHSVGPGYAAAGQRPPSNQELSSRPRQVRPSKNKLSQS